MIAYFLWEEGKVQFLAGYMEGQIKDKKKLSNYAGILFIGFGIISILFPLFLDYFYYVFSLFILWLLVGVVIINIKIR